MPSLFLYILLIIGKDSKAPGSLPGIMILVCIRRIRESGKHKRTMGRKR